MRPIFIPARAKALNADWAPGPGVFVLLPPVALNLMWRAVIPSCYKKQKSAMRVLFFDKILPGI